MTNMESWYEELARLSVPTVAQAKRAAVSIDCGIWELPNGNYIAMQQGPPVPPGSILVAKRATPNGRWRAVSDTEYDRQTQENSERSNKRGLRDLYL